MNHEILSHDFGYADLHNHLYGCLPAEILYEIGKKNPNPRWNVFTDLYEKIYGKKISTSAFFQEYNTVEKFAELYYFQTRAPFLEFQLRFNLVIALVQYTIEEMEEVAHQVALRHFQENVQYVEYRIMFSREETKPIFEERIRAVCRGLEKAENFNQSQTQASSSKEKKLSQKKEARTVLSLHRDGNYEENYQWLKELQNQDPLVRKYLVGIDFCYIEEGYPPSDKKEFFQKVLRDNKSQPSTALAILYHVGESFQDKTPFSAARWILESSEYGAHRLGHCIALGIDPFIYKNTKRIESIQERYNQLELELERYDEIVRFGSYYPKEKIEKERKKIQSQVSSGSLMDKNRIWEMEMSEKDCEYLKTFQDYCLSQIAKGSSVIESCPTSNDLIGMVPSPQSHPLPRFIQNQMRLTIGTDDPGIFHTNIQKEYQKAKEMGIQDAELESIRQQSFQYKSEILSGKSS